MLRKYVMEFIGTFFLVLTVGATAFLKPELIGLMAPLAIGSVLMVMVYAGGHISGGHYNPAVTLAVWVRGKCSLRDGLAYWVAQIFGSGAAVLAVMYLFWTANQYSSGVQPIGVQETPPQYLDLEFDAHVLLAEFLFTFALCTVVLNAATAKANQGNSFYGLAIGFTVLAGAYAVGPISQGAFNPTVAASLGLMSKLHLEVVWIYFIAELGAGLAAGLVFRLLNTDDK